MSANSPSSRSRAKFCEACGASLARTGRFCGRCGRPVDEAVLGDREVDGAPTPRLERFTFAAILGQGGSGTVYLAHDALVQRDVAVKLIDPVRAGSPGYLERFSAEVEALESISHPNVVRVVGHSCDGGLAWVATEYVPGATLRQLVDHHGPLRVPQALGVLSGALRGLACAHSRGILHGDLTPSNLLVDRSGTSLLTDFGESIGPSGRGRGVTAAYASPEAARGESLDARSDLYSMGAVLYECLVGRPPFPAGPAEVVLHRHVTEAPPQIAGVALPVQRLLDAALDKDPSRRPQSAEEFLAGLEAAAVDAEGSGWQRRASIAALVAVVGAEVEDMTAPASASAGRSLGRRALSMLAGHKAAVVATVAVVTAAGVGAGVVATHDASRSEPTATTVRSSAASSDPRAGGGTVAGVWQARPLSLQETVLPSPFGVHVVCPSASRCLVLEEASNSQGLPQSMLATTNVAGTAPTLASLPASLSTVGLTGVTCPTSTRCYAVGDDVMVTSDDGGRTWSSVAHPPVDNVEPTISCPSESTCYVVARPYGNGVGTPADVSVTSDGGRTWRSDAPLDAFVPDQFECPAVSFCVGLSHHTGSAWLYSTTDGGQSWSNWQLPNATGGSYMPTSVWCDESRACAVGAIVRQDPNETVGAPVVLTTPGVGQPWSVHALTSPSSTTASVVVACSTQSECVAALVGNGMLEAEATGDGWATAIDDSISSNLQAIDVAPPMSLTCPSTNRCLGALGSTDDQPSALLTRSPA